MTTRESKANAGAADEKGGARADTGCARCWPDDADGAWEARGTLSRETRLIDEPHFSLSILSCSGCRQRYAQVFTETIDWADGEDPQSWAVLPITADESAALAAERDWKMGAALEAMGEGRRCLRHHHPKGEAARSSWSSGLFIGLHD